MYEGLHFSNGIVVRWEELSYVTRHALKLTTRCCPDRAKGRDLQLAHLCAICRRRPWGHERPAVPGRVEALLRCLNAEEHTEWGSPKRRRLPLSRLPLLWQRHPALGDSFPA